eukprot:444330_1
MVDAFTNYFVTSVDGEISNYFPTNKNTLNLTAINNIDPRWNESVIAMKYAIWGIVDMENKFESFALHCDDLLLYHTSLIQSETLFLAFLLLIDDQNIFITTRIKAVELYTKWIINYWKTDFQPNINKMNNMLIISPNNIQNNIYNYCAIYKECQTQQQLKQTTLRLIHSLIIYSNNDINKFPVDLMETIIKYFDFTSILLDRVRALLLEFQSKQNIDVIEQKEDEHKDGMNLKYNIWKQKPKYIAQQLTLIAFEKFRNIEARELVGLQWKKNKQLSPNTTIFIEHFNNIQYWTQNEILYCKNIKQRAAKITKFLQICQHLLEINNFHTFIAIINGLDSTEITRLKKSWEKISNKVEIIFKNAKKLLSRNFNNRAVRTRQRDIPPNTACIPHVGLVLLDLVFIDEGCNSMQVIQQTAMFPNMRKIIRIKDRISFLQRYQLIEYNFERNIDFEISFCNKIQSLTVDVDDLWEKSTAIKKQDNDESQKKSLFSLFKK